MSAPMRVAVVLGGTNEERNVSLATGRAVVAALSQDTDNVFVALSARDLNPKVVVIALLANLGIAIAKLVAALVTRSGSMMAEAIHSFADSGNGPCAHPPKEGDAPRLADAYALADVRRARRRGREA